jgi:hypothetical protein
MGPGPPEATSTLGQAPSLHPSTYPLVTPPPRRKEKQKKRLNVCTNPIHTNVQKMLCNSTPPKVQHVFELCNPKRKKERKKSKNPKKGTH